MILATLLGILSSVAAEAVTALNKRLTGTVLQGNAAFLIALGISLIGAFIKIAMTPGFTFASLLNYQMLYLNLTQIFAIAQVYFFLVTKKLGLDVAPANANTSGTSVVVASMPSTTARSTDAQV